MVMISLDLWMYQVAVVMSGWLPNTAVALSVGGICTSMNAWAYMVPLGLGSAVNTLVGNTIGSGRGAEAKEAAFVGLLIAVVTVTFMVLSVATNARHFIGLVAMDPNVVALANHTVPVLCFLMFWDGLNAVLAGIMRGSGQQAVGALISFVAFVLCVPLCYFLGFQADPAVLATLPFVGGLQPVARVWLGIAIGGCAQTCLLLLYLSRFNWQAIADRAQEEENTPGEAQVKIGPEDGSGGAGALKPLPAPS
uniref:Multidrug and toxic compound extrusion protein n=1 Tax=Chlamydomonas euryale TaxID=1486919 RepID=A0A7R9V131_9CHLO